MKRLLVLVGLLVAGCQTSAPAPPSTSHPALGPGMVGAGAVVGGRRALAETTPGFTPVTCAPTAYGQECTGGPILTWAMPPPQPCATPPLPGQVCGYGGGVVIERAVAGGPYTVLLTLDTSRTTYTDTDPAIAGQTELCYKMRGFVLNRLLPPDPHAGQEVTLYSAYTGPACTGAPGPGVPVPPSATIAHLEVH